MRYYFEWDPNKAKTNGKNTGLVLSKEGTVSKARLLTELYSPRYVYEEIATLMTRPDEERN